MVFLNKWVLVLNKKEINDNSKYLGIEKDKRRELVAFIIGGPNKYYNYDKLENIKKI